MVAFPRRTCADSPGFTRLLPGTWNCHRADAPGFRRTWNARRIVGPGASGQEPLARAALLRRVFLTRSLPRYVGILALFADGAHGNTSGTKFPLRADVHRTGAIARPARDTR